MPALLTTRAPGLAPARPSRPSRRAMAGPRAAVALSQDELKQQAAWQAVDYVKSGMKLGLGTGSTAAFAVARIGDLLAKGELKDIVAVPTSIATYNQAKGARDDGLDGLRGVECGG